MKPSEPLPYTVTQSVVAVCRRTKAYQLAKDGDSRSSSSASAADTSYPSLR